MTPINAGPFSGFSFGDDEPELPAIFDRPGPARAIQQELDRQIAAWQRVPLPSGDIFADFSKMMGSLTPDHRPMLHAIHVVPHTIEPRGWTRMYRSDGRMLVYIQNSLWHSLDIQRYHGIPLVGGDPLGLGINRLTGVPVYEEDA